MSTNERRRIPIISEEDLEEIAEKASDKALEKMEKRMYERIGRTFISKFFQVIGALIIPIALYLYSKGFIKV